jgi:hypothetical protein
MDLLGDGAGQKCKRCGTRKEECELDTSAKFLTGYGSEEYFEYW